MSQKIIMLVVIVFTMGIVGCRACMAPYDYCQPTFSPESGDCCMGTLYRSGSILGGNTRYKDANSECKTCAGDFTSEDWSQEKTAQASYEEVVSSDPNYSNSTVNASYQQQYAADQNEVGYPSSFSGNMSQDFQIQEFSLGNE